MNVFLTDLLIRCIFFVVILRSKNEFTGTLFWLPTKWRSLFVSFPNTWYLIKMFSWSASSRILFIHVVSEYAIKMIHVYIQYRVQQFFSNEMKSFSFYFSRSQFTIILLKEISLYEYIDCILICFKLFFLNQKQRVPCLSWQIKFVGVLNYQIASHTVP